MKKTNPCGNRKVPIWVELIVRGDDEVKIEVNTTTELFNLIDTYFNYNAHNGRYLNDD